MSIFDFLDRIEQYMQRALAWWMSAPMDEKAAVALLVLPLLLAIVCALAVPPPGHR